MPSPLASNHALKGSVLEGDETRAQERLEVEAKVEKDLRLARWERVFFNPEGAKVLAEIVEESDLFASSFTGNSTTFFNEGKRAMGNWILQQLNALKPVRLAKIYQLIPEETENE
jgi:hypothetical protein